HTMLPATVRPVTLPPEREPGWPTSWFRAWDRFWFKPSDPTTIGLIRLCTGLVVLYVHLMYTVDLLSYVAKDAWADQGAPDSASHYMRYEIPFYTQPDSWVPPGNGNELVIGRGHFFWSIYYHVHDPVWIYTVHFGILVAMFLFTIGLWTRV